MKIDEIKKILENRIADLNMSKQQAMVSGDLELIYKLTSEIEETQISLDKLNNI